MFFIKHTELGNEKTALLEIEGPLNSETSADFEDYISKLLNNGIIYLIIDSQNIDFISSEGIGVVIYIQKKISALNGIAVYFSLSNEILMLFKMLGFDKVLSIASGRAEALQTAEKKIELGLTLTPGQAAQAGRSDATNRSQAGEAAAVPRETVQGASGDEIEPFVIKCIKCSSLVRISIKGENLCPYCNAAFTVSDSGNAVFRVNDLSAPQADTDFL